jgi:uncharacterized protein (TIGR02118 family)
VFVTPSLGLVWLRLLPRLLSRSKVSLARSSLQAELFSADLPGPHRDQKEERMIKVFGFLTKREGMQMRDFIDYYETHHVPLIRSLALTPRVYKRRYLVRDDELTKQGGVVDFDVMTELEFPDRAAFLAWMAQLSGPNAGAQVAADEAKFLDRSRTRAYIVDERVTSG